MSLSANEQRFYLYARACSRLVIYRHVTHSSHKSYLTFALELLRTCSLENNAFSVLLYVIKITLHGLMLHRFEIHSALELCARLSYATASQPRSLAKLLVGNKTVLTWPL